MQKLKVDVVSDFLCPWCYIGAKRMLKEMSRFEVEEINWHPYRLFPTSLPPLPKLEFYQQKFGPDKMEKAFTMVQKEGDTVGIIFNYSPSVIIGPTTDAHRLIMWVPKEKQTPLAMAFFLAYHEEGKPLFDHQLLTSITLEICNKDVVNQQITADDVMNFLKSEKYREEIEKQIRSVKEDFSIIGGVPHFTFKVKGKVEIPAIVSGAQHQDYFRLMLNRASQKADSQSI